MTVLIARTLARHVARRDAERASYQADLDLDRTPGELEDSLHRLVIAERALADALLARYRPDLLVAPAAAVDTLDVAAVGAPCAQCRRALTDEDTTRSGAEGVRGSCPTGNSR